jgi:hypothetical protein
VGWRHPRRLLDTAALTCVAPTVHVFSPFRKRALESRPSPLLRIVVLVWK